MTTDLEPASSTVKIGTDESDSRDRLNRFRANLEEHGGSLRKYELVWILGSDAGEEQANESIEKISSLVANAGGELAGTDIWGKRTLAYPIQKNTEGYYLQANFEIDGEKAPDLDRELGADQSIIRHLLVRDSIKPVAVADEPSRV
ncbi:MAG: 30S ribosomal protein S6 [Chloroflexi bacterium]|nr:30S ribosomal protein S6 [Chloroflexota bacterium]